MDFLSWFWVCFLGLVAFGLLIDPKASTFGGIIVLLCGVALAPPIKKKLLPDKTGMVSLWAGVLATISFALSLPPAPPVEQASTTQTKSAETVVEQKEAATTKPLAIAQPTEPKTVVVETPANRQSCKIVGISDGDTATCLTDNKQQIKLRFDQIDAPENAQDFGNASKKALSDMIFDKTVEIDTKETDKYGRIVAEIYYDGKNINKEMVAIGMAWAYREYVKDNEYVELENKARRQSLGLWSQPNAIYPSDFRRAKRGEQSSPLQTQEITKTQEKTDLKDSKGQCGSKRTCKQMSSCSEARHYLNVCGVSRLDRDGDGVPCESLCK